MSPLSLAGQGIYCYPKIYASMLASCAIEKDRSVIQQFVLITLGLNIKYAIGNSAEINSYWSGELETSNLFT